MASTVLPNGIIIPEKYSRDWYADLYHNWQELDNLLGGGTPKDGTLTIQKNGATVGTFSANQATDETVNIEVPDVNNGTLTIQQNGTTVDSFSANSSSDKTVNIQCVDLTNNQTVAGNKEFTGTTTAHDVIPSATDTYNFGSPSYQWNNAYIKSLTINGVACGDILTHNVSEFVGVSGNQTIDGNKSFTGFVIFNPYRVQIKHSSQEIGVVPSANQWNGINFTDKNNLSTFSIEQAFLSNGNTVLHFSMTPNIAGGSLLRIFESTYNASTAEIVTKSRTLIPDVNNSRDLGTSTNKWKSFNGVEPSDLSLPSDTSITIDTTNFAWGRNFTFTPSVNGYLFINIGNTNGIKSLSLKTGRGEYYFTNQTGILRFTMPVYKGKLVTILASSSAAETIVPDLLLYPLQGNV